MINNSIKYRHYAQIIVEILMHNIQKRQNKLTIIYYHDNVFSSQKIIKTEVNNMTKSTKEYPLNVPAADCPIDNRLNNVIIIQR